MGQLYDSSKDQALGTTQAPLYGQAVGGHAGWGNQDELQRLGLLEPEARELPPPSCAEPIVLEAGARATPERLERCRGIACYLLFQFHHGVDLGCVSRCADPSTGLPLIELVWRVEWGPYPEQCEASDWMAIEASMAVGALWALPFWSAVPAEEQRRLEAMLLGAHNSLSWIARSEFAAWLSTSGWWAMTLEEQLETLRAAVLESESRPWTVQETKRDVPVTAYTLEGPELVSDFQFATSKADAEVWKLTLDGGQEVEIVTPSVAAESEHYLLHVLRAADALACLPSANVELVKRVAFSPTPTERDQAKIDLYGPQAARTYMSAGADGTINVYPKGTELNDSYEYRCWFFHELGHTWSFQRWGIDLDGEGWVAWREAMKQDGCSVSRYADDSITQDVAETFAAYTSTLGQEVHKEYRRVAPARFRILDREWSQEMETP